MRSIARGKLWVGKGRKEKTLLKFFRMMGKIRTSRLQFVCSDMWKPYLNVIKLKAPPAVHVLDRFQAKHLIVRIVEMLTKMCR